MTRAVGPQNILEQVAEHPVLAQHFHLPSFVDFRRSHDNLAALVEHVVLEKPLSGKLFVFTNKQFDRIKLHFRDRNGHAIWYIRLEKDTFRLPKVAEVAAAMATLGVFSSAMLICFLQKKHESAMLRFVGTSSNRLFTTVHAKSINMALIGKVPVFFVSALSGISPELCC